MTYGTGSFSGEQYTDSITIGNITILNQGISVANKTSGFSGVDGILGCVRNGYSHLELC